MLNTALAEVELMMARYRPILECFYRDLFSASDPVREPDDSEGPDSIFSDYLKEKRRKTVEKAFCIQRWG